METVWASKDGQAFLVKGDCFEFMRAGPDESVDCIWTDPPYLLSNDGTTCVGGERVSVNKGEWDRSQGLEADHAFNTRWLTECYRLLKPSGTIWVSGTHHVYLSVGFAMMQIGFRILNDVVWEKSTPPPNLGRRCLTHASELLLWATKAKKGGEDRYTFNYDELRQENGGKQMKNVWRMRAAPPTERKHGKCATQKPLALVDRCLRASTNPGDFVFDPFAGSGTTLIAASYLGRRVYGCDNDQGNLAVAVRRLRAMDEGERLLVPAVPKASNGQSEGASPAGGAVPTGV